MHVTNIHSLNLIDVKQNNFQFHLSAATVALKSDQGHQNWNERVQLNGG